MQIKLKEKLFNNTEPHVRKYIAKNSSEQKRVLENKTLFNSFPSNEKVLFQLSIPRSLGAENVLMAVRKDGENEVLYKMEHSYFNDDIFEINLDFSTGLYFYYFIIQIENDSLYSASDDNLSLYLSKNPDKPFRLLSYNNSFKTPKWFHGTIMYHIFVDRFYKSGKSKINENAVNEKNWSADISQYADGVGGYVKNNLFFGGDLYGIIEKLSYIKSLGVTVIYLSPIFEAASNHKYDTGNYETIDEFFGGNDAFEKLIEKSKRLGIKIILDGVFNHTGDDSIYFDKYHRYKTGAYQNESSLYKNWYFIKEDGKSYDSWWGIDILPKLNFENEACRKYFTEKNGIGAKYIEKGTLGWRLDVADELSEKFLEEFRASVKEKNKDAVIIGEVWENAAEKIAYEKRRNYFTKPLLDSVMNYPFRNALIAFLKDKNGVFLANTLTEIYSEYPKCVSDSLMNILSTHDTERIITVLGDKEYSALDNARLARRKMSEEEYEKGKKLLKIAAAIQYTVYGIPSVFYGDEAGIQGGKDPFCRKTYPWGNEDSDLLQYYKQLGEIRKRNVFKEGLFKIKACGLGYIVFERFDDREKITVAANSSENEISVDTMGIDLITNKAFRGKLSGESVVIVAQKAEK